MAFGLVIAVLVVFFGVAILYDYADSGYDSGSNTLKSGTLVGKAVSAYASESNTPESNTGGGELEEAEPLSNPNQPFLKEVNSDSPDEGTKIGTFRIDGMSCGGCLYTIRGALSKVDGVEKYNVYLGYPGKAVVEYDSGIVSPQEIADAITNSGYPATIISKEDAEKISGTTSAGSCGSPTCGGSRGGGCGCGG